MLNVHNMETFRNELIDRDLGDQLTVEKNWTTLIKLLKQHKRITSYFIHLLNIIPLSGTNHTSMLMAPLVK